MREIGSVYSRSVDHSGCYLQPCSLCAFAFLQCALCRPVLGLYASGVRATRKLIMDTHTSAKGPY